MSERTAKASRAIALAWEEEQRLVQEGKGTRDWTVQQQQDILNKGKAYDDDGRAYEGHHMKSVAKYPEFQANPNVIQFLSRQEHLDAHDGCYQNPTNGYYDPHTNKTLVFEENSFIKCEPLPLSEPFVKTHVPKNEGAFVKDKNTEQAQNEFGKRSDSERTPATIFAKIKDDPIVKRVVDSVKKAGKKVWDNREMLGALAWELLGDIHDQAEAMRLEDNDRVYNRFVQDDTNSDYSYAYHDSSATSESDYDNYDSSLHGADEKGTHASPKEHTVSSHKQRYNGVWKEKSPYRRGGKKNRKG